MSLLKVIKIMGFVFVGVGIVMSVVGITMLIYAWESVHWPTTKGTIVASKVVKNLDSDNGTTYRTEVLYRYSVEGKTYTGHRISFPGPGFGASGYAQSIANRYPKAKEVSVHYKPDKPGKSILEPGADWTSYLLLGGGVVFLLGGGIIFSLIVPRVRKLQYFARG